MITLDMKIEYEIFENISSNFINLQTMIYYIFHIFIKYDELLEHSPFCDCMINLRLWFEIN